MRQPGHKHRPLPLLLGVWELACCKRGAGYTGTISARGATDPKPQEPAAPVTIRIHLPSLLSPDHDMAPKGWLVSDRVAADSPLLAGCDLHSC